MPGGCPALAECCAGGPPWEAGRREEPCPKPPAQTATSSPGGTDVSAHSPCLSRHPGSCAGRWPSQHWWKAVWAGGCTRGLLGHGSECSGKHRRQSRGAADAIRRKQLASLAAKGSRPQGWVKSSGHDRGERQWENHSERPPGRRDDRRLAVGSQFGSGPAQDDYGSPRRQLVARRRVGPGRPVRKWRGLVRRGAIRCQPLSCGAASTVPGVGNREQTRRRRYGHRHVKAHACAPSARPLPAAGECTARAPHAV